MCIHFLSHSLKHTLCTLKWLVLCYMNFTSIFLKIQSFPDCGCFQLHSLGPNSWHTQGGLSSRSEISTLHPRLPPAQSAVPSLEKRCALPPTPDVYGVGKSSSPPVCQTQSEKLTTTGVLVRQQPASVGHLLRAKLFVCQPVSSSKQPEICATITPSLQTKEEAQRDRVHC